MAEIELVLDCDDLDRQTAFWAAALGYVHAGTESQYSLLTPPADEHGPNLVLQRVPEAKTVKNRFHLDVKVPDIEAEVARLTDLGARRLVDEAFDELGERWILMADPEGNEFCVCRS
jgi:predicted enzyme related to lactoylglutathione lyase